jgi:hypothetical protein
MVCFVVLTTLKSVNALNVTSIDLDRTIAKKERVYGIPQNIIFVPIATSRIVEQEISSSEWFKGIFYYTIQRLGFSDIPFHYIVTSEGDILKGIDDIIDRYVKQEATENSIIIGYINNNKSNEITSIAESKIKELLLSICNENNINPQNIVVSNFIFNKNRSNNTIKIETQNVTGLWQIGINKIKDELKQKFNPIERNYDVTILGISTNKEEHEQASEAELTIKVKNTGKFPIYPESKSSIFLSRVNSNRSNFYLPSTWSTFSQIELTKNEEQIVLPGEETEFTTKIRIPLYTGEYSENFRIINAINKNITSNTETLKVNIKSSGKQIVEIRPVPGGQLGIRSGPGTFYDFVTTVPEGSRFYFIEQNSLGWVHIDLLDGRTGWTAVWNINFL